MLNYPFNKYFILFYILLSWLLNIKLNPNPLTALFGMMEEELTKAKQRTSPFASLLAQQAVFLRCKDTSPPTHAQWPEVLLKNWRKIRYSLQQSNKKF